MLFFLVIFGLLAQDTPINIFFMKDQLKPGDALEIQLEGSRRTVSLNEQAGELRVSCVTFHQDHKEPHQVSPVDRFGNWKIPTDTLPPNQMLRIELFIQQKRHGRGTFFLGDDSCDLLKTVLHYFQMGPCSLTTNMFLRPRNNFQSRQGNFVVATYDLESGQAPKTLEHLGKVSSLFWKDDDTLYLVKGGQLYEYSILRNKLTKIGQIKLKAYHPSGATIIKRNGLTIFQNKVHTTIVSIEADQILAMGEKGQAFLLDSRRERLVFVDENGEISNFTNTVLHLLRSHESKKARIEYQISDGLYGNELQSLWLIKNPGPSEERFCVENQRVTRMPTWNISGSRIAYLVQNSQ